MTDDQLVRKFLRDNTRTPEDSGFSERVMQRLPHRPVSVAWVTMLELLLLTIGCVLLLRWLDLTQVVCDLAIRTLQFVTYLRYVDFTFNPLYLVAILVLIAMWGERKLKTA